MKWARAGSLALVVATSALLASGADATNLPSATYVDKSGGYSITIPRTWELVPRTIPGVKALAAQLKKKKATAGLASAYLSIISSPSGKKGLKAFRFQAFDPAAIGVTPLLTEASVGVVAIKKAYGPAELDAIGAQYATSLASNKGSNITLPQRVTLPAGPAEVIGGTIPAGGGLSTGIELYLIPHGKRLYELSLQVDATYLAQATLFTAIAQHFKLL